MSHSAAHVCGVVFPGAGHAANFFNVASAIVSENLIVHALVMSKKKSLRWMESTGQAVHSNIRLEVLAGGQWEDWHEEEPKLMMQKILSPEFSAAVASTLADVRAGLHHTHKLTAMIMNGLMTNILPVAKANGLRSYLLFPSPYYMLRLSTAANPSDGYESSYVFRGLGGQDDEVVFNLGDAPDVVNPMFRKLMAESVQSTDGAICSGTNIGLEGSFYDQPHLPRELGSPKATFFVGPLMPEWFLHAPVEQDSPARSNRKVPLVAAECVQFLDEHPPQSVVYISLGSHADFSIPQAVLIISLLRGLNVPYILVKREDKQELVNALGPYSTPGIITKWAPQLEILSHPSLRCFLSHAGFGSMLEGIVGGTPFISCPVASDQFLDSKVMNHLGVSVGTIAVNKHISQMQRTTPYPILPDDAGKQIEALFRDLFATTDGEAKLSEARRNVLKLRTRILRAKAEEGARELSSLKRVLMA
ncbi:hypothetical protein B0A49_13146 [Cryomyces minteri]|uniref:UDP-glycosyltransferases domain-containing protein n=1 Tax=Cryomyces minteri TaxID=331657 RepID=A0A4U0WHQ2_9PEZI|nr:hypothetical protein B0A49_13146 [Cryomyces minteri]